jgi:hypothetical protein
MRKCEIRKENQKKKCFFSFKFVQNYIFLSFKFVNVSVLIV